MTLQDTFGRLSPVTLMLVAACYGYRTAVAPSPGTQVRIVLTAATTIAVLPTPPETLLVHYDHVLELSGAVQATSRDTIAVRLGELRRESGPIGGLSHAVALVPVDRVSQMTERHFQAGRTVLGTAGVLLLATTVLIVLLIVTVTKAADG